MRKIVIAITVANHYKGMDLCDLVDMVHAVVMVNDLPYPLDRPWKLTMPLELGTIDVTEEIV